MNKMSVSISNEGKDLISPAQNIEVLATHKILIEKKTREIKLGWKLTPAILYFTCAITGYSTSILFHIFWHEIFNNNCPLWAHITPPPRTRIIHLKNSLGLDNEAIVDVIIHDWRRNVIVTFKHEYNCNYYHAVCMCSCLFGVIWCMLFARCASGIYAAQWLIVSPALIFQIVFTIIVINTMRDVEAGYANFINGLTEIAPMFMNATELAAVPRKCQLVGYYLQAYGLDTSRICNVQTSLQTLSWIMVLAWIGGLFFLILRIIVVDDFRLRKTTVYKVPDGEIIPITLETVDTETIIEKNRIKGILRYLRKK